MTLYKKTKAPKAALRTKMPGCHSFNASVHKDINFFSNPNIMDQFISFLKDSNRYKHLLWGVFVGLFALSSWTAIYSAIVAASCLELKDKMRGCYWDWGDWLTTIAGGGIAAILWLFL